MTRRTATPDPTQDKPTAPQPVDANGRLLDQFGVPLNGPARIAALAELEKPDPNTDPAAWGVAPADETPTNTVVGDAGNEGA